MNHSTCNRAGKRHIIHRSTCVTEGDWYERALQKNSEKWRSNTGRLQLCHKNLDSTPTWLISITKMASALRPIEFSAYYETLYGPEKEKEKEKKNPKRIDVWV